MGKWGFIDTSGKLVIDFLFDKPHNFSDGYAKVVLNGEWCFINQQGEKVISLNQYAGGSSFHNGFAIVSKWKKPYYAVYGIIDKTGKEVVPCKVDCMKLSKYFKCGNLAQNIIQYNKGYFH